MDVEYSFEPIKDMMTEIGVSEEDQAQIFRTYDAPRIHRHAAYTIYGMQTKAAIKNPVAWFKASLRGNWNAPPGFGAQQQVLYFRIDESTWARMESYVPCALCGGDHKSNDCPSTKGK